VNHIWGYSKERKRSVFSVVYFFVRERKRKRVASKEKKERKRKERRKATKIEGGSTDSFHE